MKIYKVLLLVFLAVSLVFFVGCENPTGSNPDDVVTDDDNPDNPDDGPADEGTATLQVTAIGGEVFDIVFTFTGSGVIGYTYSSNISAWDGISFPRPSSYCISESTVASGKKEILLTIEGEASSSLTSPGSEQTKAETLFDNNAAYFAIASYDPDVATDSDPSVIELPAQP